MDEFAAPDEFERRLEQDPALSAAFEALTPGRRRAYLLHFSAPKQSKTRGGQDREGGAKDSRREGAGRLARATTALEAKAALQVE